MTTVDWIALAVIALAALNGLRRGLVGGVFSLAGIAAGAYFGAKLAPQLLSGSESPYTPLVALGGAVVLGRALPERGVGRGEHDPPEPLRGVAAARARLAGRAGARGSRGRGDRLGRGRRRSHMPGQTGFVRKRSARASSAR